MRFGKLKPVPDGDKRLRCPRKVVRFGEPRDCGRLAAEFIPVKNGMSFPAMVLCRPHKAWMEEQGYEMKRVDRRRKKAK